MNIINFSSSSSRRTSSAEYSDSGFYQALRDKSLYARLITPPGPKALLIAVALSVLNGLTVFIYAGDISATTADIATSFALIMLFSLVFGTWLGVIVGTIYNNLTIRTLVTLESRVDKLSEGTAFDAAQVSEDKRTDYQSILYTFLYILSFPVLGSCLMFRALHRYAYVDSPPEVSVLLSLTINGITAFTLISIAACAFLMCWVWARVIRLRHRIGVLEKKSDPATLATDIRTLASPNMSAIDYIARAHRQTVRFVTGVF